MDDDDKRLDTSKAQAAAYLNQYPPQVGCFLQALDVDPLTLRDPKPQSEYAGVTHYTADYRSESGKKGEARVEIVDWFNNGPKTPIADVSVSVWGENDKPFEYRGRNHPRRAPATP